MKKLDAPLKRRDDGKRNDVIKGHQENEEAWKLQYAMWDRVKHAIDEIIRDPKNKNQFQDLVRKQLLR